MATSILDYIFRELAVSYLGRYDLAQVQPSQAIDAMGPEPEYIGEEDSGEVHYLPAGTPAPKAARHGRRLPLDRRRTGAPGGRAWWSSRGRASSRRRGRSWLQKRARRSPRATAAMPVRSAASSRSCATDAPEVRTAAARRADVAEKLKAMVPIYTEAGVKWHVRTRYVNNGITCSPLGGVASVGSHNLRATRCGR